MHKRKNNIFTINGWCRQTVAESWLVKLSFIFPDPEPDPANSGHYKKFEEVYTKETSQRYRPSLNQGKGKLSEKDAGFPIKAETVHAVVN